MEKENNKQTHDKNDHLVNYLQLIQEPINRMSTTSAIYKGFAATTFAGYNILAPETIEIVDGIIPIARRNLITSFIISVVSLLVFMALDMYYLRLERKLRYLYENVRIGEHPCDFKIDFIEKQEKEKIKDAKARLRDCLRSPSIYLFYGPILVVEIIIFVLRINGVL